MEVTVYGWKVLLLIDAATNIPNEVMRQLERLKCFLRIPQDDLFQRERAALSGAAIRSDADAAGGWNPTFGDQTGLR
jgi:hypothetical protein